MEIFNYLGIEANYGGRDNWFEILLDERPTDDLDVMGAVMVGSPVGKFATDQRKDNRRLAALLRLTWWKLRATSAMLTVLDRQHGRKLVQGIQPPPSPERRTLLNMIYALHREIESIEAALNAAGASALVLRGNPDARPLKLVYATGKDSGIEGSAKERRISRRLSA